MSHYFVKIWEQESGATLSAEALRKFVGHPDSVQLARTGPEIIRLAARSVLRTRSEVATMPVNDMVRALVDCLPDVRQQWEADNPGKDEWATRLPTLKRPSGRRSLYPTITEPTPSRPDPSRGYKLRTTDDVLELLLAHHCDTPSESGFLAWVTDPSLQKLVGFTRGVIIDLADAQQIPGQPLDLARLASAALAIERRESQRGGSVLDGREHSGSGGELYRGRNNGETAQLGPIGRLE